MQVRALRASDVNITGVSSVASYTDFRLASAATSVCTAGLSSGGTLLPAAYSLGKPAVEPENQTLAEY